MASHPRRDERSGTLRPVRHGRCAPGLPDPFDESVVVLRDDWDEAAYCACEWSDPNTAAPYECVGYDLRLLAEETDPDPRHTGGLVRHRTNYALAGFDYLTFAA